MHNYILDLFQPYTIIEAIIYQYGNGTHEWDSKHLRAMLHLCDYMRHTYPHAYHHVEPIYEHLLTVDCTIEPQLIPGL